MGCKTNIITWTFCVSDSHFAYTDCSICHGIRYVSGKTAFCASFWTFCASCCCCTKNMTNQCFDFLTCKNRYSSTRLIRLKNTRNLFPSKSRGCHYSHKYDTSFVNWPWMKLCISSRDDSEHIIGISSRGCGKKSKDPLAQN